ncbi:hypothetical protein D3C78_1370130 [compost metagenome]
MRGGAAAVEQTGLGQQESAAAHRHHSPRDRGITPQPRGKFGVLVEGLADIGCAGYDEGVQRGNVQFAQRSGVHGQTFNGIDQTTLKAGGVQLITGLASFGQGFARGPEHRLRATEVEQAHSRVGNKHHVARFGRSGEGNAGH